MQKAIFLDRDGILNKIVMRGEKVSSPYAANEFEILPEAPSLVQKIKSLGYLAIVATNQPDVSKGFIPEDQLNLMHQKLKTDLKVDNIETCVSADDSDPRRKPNPGMLVDASKKYGIDLNESFFIGDSIKDIVAGKRAGVQTILLQTEYNLAYHGAADFNCNSLNEVSSIIQRPFVAKYLKQSREVAARIDVDAVEKVVDVLYASREKGGRLFIVGSGGGAGHASHAVCDFRKLCGFDAHAPTDNVSELTARINDEGWSTCLSEHLKVSRINANDCVLVFSVGGGDEKKNVSPNLVNAVRYAKEKGASVVGVVGRDGGYTAEKADACVLVPTVDSALITPHTESFQALIWHLLVSHPKLQLHQTKWESMK